MSRKPNPAEGRRLRQIVASAPEIMGGTPVFRGTRIPVDLIADMLAQGVSPEEILEGYPTVDKKRIAMAPLCTRRSRRKRPPAEARGQGKNREPKGRSC